MRYILKLPVANFAFGHTMELEVERAIGWDPTAIFSIKTSSLSTWLYNSGFHYICDDVDASSKLCKIIKSKLNVFFL